MPPRPSASRTPAPNRPANDQMPAASQQTKPKVGGGWAGTNPKRQNTSKATQAVEKLAPKKAYYPVGYTGPRDEPVTTPSTPEEPVWNIKNQPATPRPTRPPASGTPITGAGPKGISFPIPGRQNTGAPKPMIKPRGQR
jgi:hypothetical protein